MIDQQPLPIRAFAIYAILAIGALMMTLCGGCTAVVIGASLWSLMTHRPDEAGFAIFVIAVAAIVGVAPTFLGFVVFRNGLERLRRTLKPPPSAPPPG